MTMQPTSEWTDW